MRVQISFILRFALLVLCLFSFLLGCEDNSSKRQRESYNARIGREEKKRLEKEHLKELVGKFADEIVTAFQNEFGSSYLLASGEKAIYSYFFESGPNYQIKVMLNKKIFVNPNDTQKLCTSAIAIYEEMLQKKEDETLKNAALHKHWLQIDFDVENLPERYKIYTPLYSYGGVFDDGKLKSNYDGVKQRVEDFKRGWPTPEIASGYLASEGLPTGEYKYRAGNDYSSLSNYQEIRSGFPLSNNIAYYVEGERNRVRELKLVLNVNQPRFWKEAHEVLLRYSKSLYQKILKQQMPQKIGNTIIQGYSGKWTVQNITIELLRDDWPSGKGYSLKFVIHN